MKHYLSTSFVILSFFVLSSCSKVVSYGPPSSESGNLIIRTSSPVYANLTLNDSLMLKYKYVKSITIKNVPKGTNSIHFSADSYNLKHAMDKQMNVDIKAGKTNTQLLTVPPKSNGYFIANAITIVGLYSFLFLIY